MSMYYTNRVGQKYYLREGKTKTGKPRYFFSAQDNGKGEAVDYIPDEYEIYEYPENAQVFLRKKRPQLITDLEKHFIKKRVGALQRSRRYLVDCKDEYITIYESNTEAGKIKGIFGEFMKGTSSRPGIDIENMMGAFVEGADRHYTAMLRFGLVDAKQRTFSAERFCFRGAIDDWVYLGGPDKFKNIVETYVDSLGTEAFFELPHY